ncbi:Uncharacterised protein [Paenibacillus polymyxa]|nr:Uncharacterised protein [Paenibacillus polymyxa]
MARDRKSDLLPLEAAVETERTEAVAEKISELCSVINFGMVPENRTPSGRAKNESQTGSADDAA